MPRHSNDADLDRRAKIANIRSFCAAVIIGALSLFVAIAGWPDERLRKAVGMIGPALIAFRIFGCLGIIACVWLMVYFRASFLKCNDARLRLEEELNVTSERFLRYQEQANSNAGMHNRDRDSLLRRIAEQNNEIERLRELPPNAPVGIPNATEEQGWPPGYDFPPGSSALRSAGEALASSLEDARKEAWKRYRDSQL